MPSDSPPPSPPPPDSGPFAFPPPPDPEWPAFNAPQAGFYPLDFDRIVRTGLSLFRFGWRTMIGAALIPYAIAYAVLVPISASVSPQFNDWVARYQDAVENNLALPPLPSGQTLGVLLLVGAALLTLLAGVIASAAIIHIGDAQFRGRRTTARAALGVALRRSLALIGQQLLLVLAMFGIILIGVVLSAFFIAGGSAAAFLGIVLIVASFAAVGFIAVRWLLGPQAVVVEEVGAVEGLSRSWRLVAGSGWRVLGYVIVFAVASFAATVFLTAIPQTILGFDPTRPLDVALGTVLDGAATVLVAPLVPLLGLLLYYDLRFRKGEPTPQPGEAREET